MIQFHPGVANKGNYPKQKFIELKLNENKLTHWFCLFRQADELPLGFAKLKDIAMLGIGAAFKCFDTYSDMALAYILYTGSYSGVDFSWNKAD